jgi:hypothetical protein
MIREISLIIPRLRLLMMTAHAQYLSKCGASY